MSRIKTEENSNQALCARPRLFDNISRVSAQQATNFSIAQCGAVTERATSVTRRALWLGGFCYWNRLLTAPASHARGRNRQIVVRRATSVRRVGRARQAVGEAIAEGRARTQDCDLRSGC